MAVLFRSSSPPPDPRFNLACARARSPPPAVCKQQRRHGQGEARSCLARHCFSSLFFSHLAISLYVASDRIRPRAAMVASPSTLRANASLLFALTPHRSSSHGYRASYCCFSFQFRQTCTRVWFMLRINALFINFHRSPLVTRECIHPRDPGFESQASLFLLVALRTERSISIYRWPV